MKTFCFFTHKKFEGQLDIFFKLLYVLYEINL